MCCCGMQPRADPLPSGVSRWYCRGVSFDTPLACRSAAAAARAASPGGLVERAEGDVAPRNLRMREFA